MYGWGRGFWPRGRRFAISSGYSYMGPCRCGMGPHAYFQDPAGRVVHAWHPRNWLWASPEKLTAEELQDEIKCLKEEKTELEKHLKELEEELKRESK